MGYYTYFTLAAEPASVENGELVTHPMVYAGDAARDLEGEIRKMGVFDYIHVNSHTVDAEGENKWYESNDDMIAISARFPGFFFTLYGDGEEEEDKWVMYYFGGKSCGGSAKIDIEYPSFDLKKLEAPGNKALLSPNYQYSYQ